MRLPSPLTPFEAGAGAVFGALSAIRRARIFHPDGTAFTATLTIDGGDHPIDVLAGEHDAVVRLSRGAGLPPPAPDVFGLAIKVLNAHGSGAHQDFLLATSASGFPGRHVLLPTVGAAARPYSSILRYRNVRGEAFVIGAFAIGAAAGDGEVRRFNLATAGLLGGWTSVGGLELADPLAHDQAQRLRFSPWHTGGGLMPSGFLNRLRRTAYAASQATRPDSRPATPDAGVREGTAARG